MLGFLKDYNFSESRNRKTKQNKQNPATSFWSVF